MEWVFLKDVLERAQKKGIIDPHTEGVITKFVNPSRRIPKDAEAVIHGVLAESIPCAGNVNLSYNTTAAIIVGFIGAQPSRGH